MTPIFPGGHFYIEEIQCPHCSKVWPHLHTDPLYAEFFGRMEALRTAMGVKFIIARGGGARCLTYEKMYHGDVLLSPHSFCALDVSFDSAARVRSAVVLTKRLYPDMRMGYDQYLAQGLTFIHFDMCHRLSPLPLGVDFQWQPGASW
jgi:hypothetical protein